MAERFELIAGGTRVETNGESQVADISGQPTRTFLCTLEITDQIEQESIDVSIWGSEDGQSWPAKPVLKLPQQFYRGRTQMVLDVAARPEVKFIKAKWELFRWGRVAPLPMFAIGLTLEEVPAMPRGAAARPVEAGH